MTDQLEKLVLAGQEKATLKERLEKCEEMLRKSQRIEKEGIQAIASAAAAEKRLEKYETEWQQPDDAFLRIGAPAVPFLEQVEWMRKRLVDLEEAARPFLEFYDDMDTHAMREAQKRLAELLDKGN